MALGEKITYSPVSDKKEIVSFFYNLEDEGWHKNIHKRGGTVDENIENTLSEISEDSTMFLIECDGEKAAFFVKYKDSFCCVLTGFHVIKKYRLRWFMDKYWHLLKEEFKDDIYCGLYYKNGMAINHLIKQGFFILKEALIDNKKYIILRKKLLCH